MLGHESYIPFYWFYCPEYMQSQLCWVGWKTSMITWKVAYKIYDYPSHLNHVGRTSSQKFASDAGTVFQSCHAG